MAHGTGKNATNHYNFNSSEETGVDGRDIAHYGTQIRRKLEDHNENDIEDHCKQSILIASTGSSSCPTNINQPTNITLTPADTTLTPSL